MYFSMFFSKGAHLLLTQFEVGMFKGKKITTQLFSKPAIIPTTEYSRFP